MALLWPDCPHAAAQNTLRVTLSRIRQALGDSRNVLRTDPQTVTLALPETWQIDALCFDRAVTAIRSHTHRTTAGCPDCLAHLRQAAALYHGPFLAGLASESETFQAWATHQEDAIYRAALEVFGHLAEHALRVHDWSAAQNYAGQQLHLEPWCEAAYRQLMLALAQQGRRTTALAHYHTCCDILQREFGIEPESDTRYVYELIRAGHIPAPAPLTFSVYRQALAIDQLPLIGRESEIAELTNLINRPDTQLISVIGAGGIGKTRLAIRVAQQMRSAFRDGVRYVFLHSEEGAALSFGDPGKYLARCIADACQIDLNDRHSPSAQVIDALKTRAYLLVLDGFEHVAAANLFLGELLEAAPDCVALVTSRQRLHLRREHVLKLGPLSTRSDCERYSPSAQLFVSLASRGGTTITDERSLDEVERICTTLAGIPLGIELAAACLTSIDLPTLRQHVQHSFEVLGNPLADLPVRHRSLDAVLESTWQTLTAVGRQALAMLSVAHAPCPQEAALAIIGHEQALEELLDMALVHRLGDGNVWFHEHVCRFAAEKLTNSFAAMLTNEAHRRHAAWFLRWLSDSHYHLHGAESFTVRERLMTSLRDLDAAWFWALTHSEWNWVADAVFAYEDLHYLSGHFIEGLERIHRSLAYVNTPDQLSTYRLRACLLVAYASLQRYRQRRTEIEAMLREAAELAVHIADPLLQMQALSCLGIQQTIDGAYEDARATLTEVGEMFACRNGKEATVDAIRIEIMYRRALSNLDLRTGYIVQAEDHARKALQLAVHINSDLAIARSFETLSNAIGAQDRLNEAEDYLRQALEIYRRLHLVYQQTNVLDLLAQQFDARGDYAQAQRYYMQALALARECGNRDAEMVSLVNLGISYDQMGHYEQALFYTQTALALCDAVGHFSHHTTILANLSLHAHHNQRHEMALFYACAATDQAQAASTPDLEAYGYDFQGHALLALGRIDEAEQAYRQAWRIRQQLNTRVLMLESQAGLTRVALARNDAPEALRRVTPIVEHLLNGGNLYGAEETLRVYWTAYQTLRANHDPRAATVLDLGQRLIHERAAWLSDAASRSIYLNVEVNRSMLAAGSAGLVMTEDAAVQRPMVA
ncbi:ATP-binding protein [Roseiflexus sp.]|uniref:ATP-binding protein n=1 Tax=Roseiflexus sp. TaxID=2562120 RepID=UPI00398AD459